MTSATKADQKVVWTVCHGEGGDAEIQQQTPGAREHHARERMGAGDQAAGGSWWAGKQTGVRAVTSARKNHSLRVRDGRRQKKLLARGISELTGLKKVRSDVDGSSGRTHWFQNKGKQGNVPARTLLHQV